MEKLPDRFTTEPNFDQREILRQRIIELKDVADINRVRYVEVLLESVPIDQIAKVIEAGIAANKSLSDMLWLNAMFTAAKELMPDDKDKRRQLILRAWELKDEEQRFVKHDLRSDDSGEVIVEE